MLGMLCLSTQVRMFLMVNHIELLALGMIVIANTVIIVVITRHDTILYNYPSLPGKKFHQSPASSRSQEEYRCKA